MVAAGTLIDREHREFRGVQARGQWVILRAAGTGLVECEDHWRGSAFRSPNLAAALLAMSVTSTSSAKPVIEGFFQQTTCISTARAIISDGSELVNRRHSRVLRRWGEVSPATSLLGIFFSLD